MAKATFQRYQRVWVECVGAWAVIDKIEPIWARGFEEPVRVTYEVGLGRPFLAHELRAEDAAEAAEALVIRAAVAAAAGPQQVAGAAGLRPPSLPRHLSGGGDRRGNDWGGWRVPGAEYDRDPRRIEQQARLIASAPMLRNLVRELLQNVAEAPDDAPPVLQDFARRAMAVERYITDTGPAPPEPAKRRPRRRNRRCRRKRLSRRERPGGLALGMRTDNTPQPIRLSDYRPPAYLVDEVRLEFVLAPGATRVKASLAVRRNGDHAEPLQFNGERLKPVSVAIDGRPLAQPADYEVDDAEFLTIAEPPGGLPPGDRGRDRPRGQLGAGRPLHVCGALLHPVRGRGLPQDPPYFPDRPDVLARFTVRIEAEKAFQRLLSNGNLIEAGDLPGDRHYAVWNDPFPKPCYLFALVAGELDVLEDSFVTLSGRTVALRIFVDPGMADRALYAMDSLKRAMRWDEESWGREYDLDLFMIVAVRDFNFGAMENKGLNIFNSSLVLADPATATDADYERIEAVIAHEYFHNWTGDRITCRDWFQLCLKEGLTVFRDQGFSADMRGEAVQRIKEVRQLRARQFSEDAGPLGHPVHGRRAI